MKNEITRAILDKAEHRQNPISQDLLDVHSNYDSNKACLTSVGGNFQQWFYVVSSIMDVYGDNLEEYYERRRQNPADELSKKPLTAREILVENFFLPFFATFIREVKGDGITIMATEDLARSLAEMKVTTTSSGVYELHRMSNSNYIKFRSLFVENLMNNELWQRNF